jgi:hypothetical protein
LYHRHLAGSAFVPPASCRLRFCAAGILLAQSLEGPASAAKRDHPTILVGRGFNRDMKTGKISAALAAETS